MNLFETLVALITALFVWWTPTLSPTSSPVETTAVVVSVIDGDTIIVSIGGQEESVRYIGIDTPEPRRAGEPECGSDEATNFNRDLVAGQTVRLVADTEDRDRYNRLLRYVYVGTGDTERFVNAELLRAGLATPLTVQPNNLYAADFALLAEAAKTADVGIWSLCDV